MSNTSLGFHTFSIFRKLSNIEYKELCKDFRRYIKNNKDFKGYRDEKCKGYVWEYSYKENKGIRWRLSCKTELNGYTTRKIEAIINPKTLCFNNYITAATEFDLQKTEELFNEEAENISSYLLSFNDYSLNRADYCLNIDLLELGYSCTPQQMMKLIKQGDIPEFFTERAFYSETGHRFVTDKNSFYLINSSVTVNYYLKYAQQNENHPNYMNRNESENVLRLEVQCKRKKLYDIYCDERNSNIYNDDGDRAGAIPIRPMLCNNCSEVIVRNYIEKVIRNGHYFTYDGAIEIIKLYKFKKKKQDRLIDAIDLINDKKGIANAKNHLMHSATEAEYQKKIKEFNQALTELDELLINPVTIPRRWNIKYIPNIIFAYNNAAYEELFLNKKEVNAMKYINKYLRKSSS